MGVLALLPLVPVLTLQKLLHLMQKCTAKSEVFPHSTA